jgi:hypothetical protein
LPDVPEQRASDSTVFEGHRVYAQRCLVCHGFSAVSGGLVSDLRYSDKQVYAQWDAIVLGGSRSSDGMPPFAGVVTPAQSQAIKAYIIDIPSVILGVVGARIRAPMQTRPNISPLWNASRYALASSLIP